MHFKPSCSCKFGWNKFKIIPVREGREWAWVGARGEMGSAGPWGHSHTLLSARKMNPLASLPHPKNSFRILSASFFSCLAFQQTAKAVATWIKAVKLIQLSQFEALAFSISPRLYRAALKGSSQVLWNWVKKLCFVCLLQAGERNFFTPFSHNLGREVQPCSPTEQC